MLKEWMKFEEKVKEKEKSRKKSKQTIKRDMDKNKELDSIEKQKKIWPRQDQAVNYLEGREISKTVIDEIVNRKMLYESYKHECVFIGYNQNRLVS